MCQFRKQRFIRYISGTVLLCFCLENNLRRTLVWSFPFSFRFVRPLYLANSFIKCFFHDSFDYHVHMIRVVVHQIAFLFSSFSLSTVTVQNVYNFLDYFNKDNHCRTCCLRAFSFHLCLNWNIQRRRRLKNMKNVFATQKNVELLICFKA